MNKVLSKARVLLGVGPGTLAMYSIAAAKHPPLSLAQWNTSSGPLKSLQKQVLAVDNVCVGGGGGVGWGGGGGC